MLTNNTDKCQACGKQSANKLSQLYGQPYNQQSLRSREPEPSELDAKVCMVQYNGIYCTINVLFFLEFTLNLLDYRMREKFMDCMMYLQSAALL